MLKALSMTTAALVAIWLAAASEGQAAELTDPLVAEGKQLYEEGASEAGCAMCHGMDATGDPDAGGVYIQGVLVSQMESALNGGVEQMEFFDLSRHEVEAIQAYLDYLYTHEMSQVDPVAYPGMKIFMETAGGVGCASCHSEDATGDVGPNIQGRTADDIRRAMANVEKMSIIELTDEEIEQVATYLTLLMEASGN